jgi:ATP-dependent DNA ligase
MLARLADEIPRGPGWRYEPKWDGFRALVFRDGDRLRIASRNGQPLERYFPELLPPLRAALPERAVVDGEIVVPGGEGLDFDALLQRIHPAASRIERLARETPASFVAFDVLALGDEDLRGRPFRDRREFLARALRAGGPVLLTPETGDGARAVRWFERFQGAGIEGVVAKREELPYVAGERVMIKVKHERTADCVVGGYRVSEKGGGVASLLLGLYDDEGRLRHVGHVSAFPAALRRDLAARLRPLEGGEGFAGGFGPAGPSRWARGRDTSWVAVRPELVVEVRFDQLQGGRFRHAAQLLHFRADKPPRECTFDQVLPARPFALAELAGLAAEAGVHAE